MSIIQKTGVVKEVYKDEKHKWCVRTSTGNKQKYTYIDIANKPFINGEEVIKGMVVRKGDVISC